MTLTQTKTPTWLIERVAQDELDADEVRQIRERLAAEGRSMDDELDALRKSNREILTQLPRAMMGTAIRSRAERAASSAKASRWRPAMLIAPMALAGSVALAIVMVRGEGGGQVTSPHTPSAMDEEIGIKGDVLRSPRLLVYRQKPGQGPGLGGSERLSDGARAARGDLLQLAYDKSPDGLFGVLLSIDGAGRITQHLPEEGARTPAPLTSVREIPLPSAYELDDAPAFERFILVTATQPFAIGVVLDAAQALAKRGPSAQNLPLELGPSFRQTSVLLHKTSKGAP
jgi:hypothetical protein